MAYARPPSLSCAALRALGGFLNEIADQIEHSQVEPLEPDPKVPVPLDYIRDLRQRIEARYY